MQKQCQDGFYTTFSSYRKMLDYHQEQSMNSRWIKSKVSDLGIQPLGKGSALSADLSAFAAGTTQDAVDDTAVFPKQKDIKKQPMFTCLQTKEYCY